MFIAPSPPPLFLGKIGKGKISYLMPPMGTVSRKWVGKTCSGSGKTGSFSPGAAAITMRRRRVCATP